MTLPSRQARTPSSIKASCRSCAVNITPFFGLVQVLDFDGAMMHAWPRTRGLQLLRLRALVPYSCVISMSPNDGSDDRA